MPRPDEIARAIAAAHYGLLTFAEASAAGLSVAQIKHRVRSGEWIRLHRGVYLLAATPRSFEQDVLAALLAAGPFAVASHRTAAALWGLRGIEPGALSITVPAGGVGTMEGVTYHRTDTLPAHHWTTRDDGIRVMSVARTLLDLGADASEVEVERAVHDAEFRNLVSRPELVRLLHEVGGRGRRGTAHLRAVVEKMAPLHRAAESELELRFLRDVVNPFALPVPVSQLRIGRMRVDFAYPDVRLAIELDGERWHGAASDRARDRRRDLALAAKGWTVQRWTWSDVADHPQMVAQQLARTLASRGRPAALPNQRRGGRPANSRAWRG